MNKQDLINSITDDGDITRKQAEIVLARIESAVAAALVDDEEVTLPGIGKLKVKERAARTGRNPQTGSAVAIAAKRVVKFSAAKALAEAVE